MRRNWTQRFLAWLQGHSGQSTARRRTPRRRPSDDRYGALISRLEVLESRQLLTNLVAVNVSGGAVTLTDTSERRVKTGDFFDVSYTSTQVVLTAHGDTLFQVGGQSLSTFTATVTSPVSIDMKLSSHGNTVAVVGDGTTKLTSLSVDMNRGRQNNSLSVSNVITDSMTINGGRRDDIVTVSQTTVNNNLSSDLGHRRRSNDVLDLENTTVKGNVEARTHQLITNHVTVTGTLNSVQLGRDSTLTSTASTFTGAVSVDMGRDSVIDLKTSTDGPNRFQSSETVTGHRRGPITINAPQNSVVNAVPPTLKNAVIQGPATQTVSVGTPTVNSLTSVKNTPKITGTYDSAKAPLLTVAVNNKTYKLGTDAQLTAPTTGNWSLDLTGAPLPSGSSTVTVTNSDSAGNTASGTGTVTTDDLLNTQLTSIRKFETTNSLTAKETDSGLNYVITTNGTGAVPVKDQTLSVNYTGHILNADGTLGIEFDSNIDAQFNHVSPFTFKLGTGQVIKGWDEAFALLPVGTVARLLIPSKLAYGITGQGSNIPANAILIFDVTVISAT